MKIYFIQFSALVLIGLLLVACLANGWDKKTTMSKGANRQMETFYIGRFSIAVPAEMQEANGSRYHQIRDEEIKEIVWPKGINPEKARETEWNNLLTKILEIAPPRGKDKVVIRNLDFPNLGKWAKGVLYYASESSRTASWLVLMDTGPTGFLIKDNPPVLLEEENKNDNAIKNITNICKFYHVMDSTKVKPTGDWFYLKYGAINLPYMWQEESDVRFEGHPLKLVLRVRMHETQAVEKSGLIDKTIAAIVSGYANGVDIEKIRSHKRSVAGLNGEEEVLRETESGKASLNFAWEYNGIKDSGESPRIIITMDSPNGNLEEKLKIWDAILDSMKPMFVRIK